MSIFALLLKFTKKTHIFCKYYFPLKFAAQSLAMEYDQIYQRTFYIKACKRAVDAIGLLIQLNFR